MKGEKEAGCKIKKGRDKRKRGEKDAGCQSDGESNREKERHATNKYHHISVRQGKAQDIIKVSMEFCLCVCSKCHLSHHGLGKKA